MTLRQAIQEVQKVGQEHGFTIVIVGGALVRLIGSKTTIKKIDEDKRIIFLEGAENPSVVREEDKKTIVDIDAIAFSSEQDPFTKAVKDEFYLLLKDHKALRNSDFPAISVEPVLYHPHFPKPKQVTQFVSSVESYHDHDYFFRLGSVKQDVKKRSLAFWTYNIGKDQDIVSINPIAIQKRYAIRGFSVKPKDKEKMWGEQSVFSKFVKDFNLKTHNVFEKDFIEWDEFAQRVAASTNPSMRLKKGLWNAYWATIGTYLAHGTGIAGKMLLPLGNTLFAGK